MPTSHGTSRETVFLLNLAIPGPISVFLYFSRNFNSRLWTYAGFKLVSMQQKATTLTIQSPPLPSIINVSLKNQPGSKTQKKSMHAYDITRRLFFKRGNTMTASGNIYFAMNLRFIFLLATSHTLSICATATGQLFMYVNPERFGL